jgi:Uma2 family endonuclease
MKIEEPDLNLTYTYADYLTWELPDMVELIQGKVYKMSPAPTSLHQRISRRLLVSIGAFLKKRKCEVFSAPFDVRLRTEGKGEDDRSITTVVQPDICVICDPTKIDSRGCLGAPDWIIEIISPNTSHKDLHEKFDIYQGAAVKEYWIIHPQDQTLLVFLLNAQKMYETKVRPLTRGDIIYPDTLPELAIDLNEIFDAPTTS